MKIFSKLIFVIVLFLLVSACQPRKPEYEIASAVQQNNVEKVREYLAKGGDPNMKSRFGDPLLYLASGRKGGAEVTKLLIEAGADVNASGRNGIPILTSAASWCNIEEISLLLRAGADVNIRGKKNKTPLESVCQTPKDRRNLTIQILKQAGAE